MADDDQQNESNRRIGNVLSQIFSGGGTLLTACEPGLEQPAPVVAGGSNSAGMAALNAVTLPREPISGIGFRPNYNGLRVDTAGLQSNPLLRLAGAHMGEHEVRNNTILSKYLSNAAGRHIDPSIEPWCADFVNAVCHEAGLPMRTAAAGSFETYGTEAVIPQAGDIVVIEPSAGQRHVGFLVGMTKDGKVLVLGGNQSNEVCVETFNKDQIITIRHPPAPDGNALIATNNTTPPPPRMGSPKPFSV